MKPLAMTCLLLPLLLILVLIPPAEAAREARAHPYYSNGRTINHWVRYGKGDHYGTRLRFKGKDGNDKSHYVYYYPKRGPYLYFYNPDTKRFWGRCPARPSRSRPYEILNAEDQSGQLDDIPETKFIKLTVKLEVTLLVRVSGELQKQLFVINPSADGMPPLPGFAGERDPEPLPPPPPLPDSAGSNFVDVN